MLRELIPGDLMKVQSSADWKRAIVASYNQDAGKYIGLPTYTIHIEFEHKKKCIVWLGLDGHKEINGQRYLLLTRDDIW